MTSAIGVSRRWFINKGLGFIADKVSEYSGISELFLPPPLEATFLYYHDISYLKLKLDLLNLMRQWYQPISIGTLIGHFKGEQPIPKNQPVFLLTLDDGKKSQYEAVLRATEEVEKETKWFIPANFFIMTNFNETPTSEIPYISGNTPSYDSKSLSRDEIVDLLKQRHEVYNHTINHSKLTTLDVGKRNDEVENGEKRVDVLWDLAGRKKQYKVLAYPYGLYNGQLIQYLQDLKY
ncbi:MAG: polysaccharide deacetylase family protein, partial [Candidatus Daviesbacteria bacterium]